MASHSLDVVIKRQNTEALLDHFEKLSRTQWDRAAYEREARARWRREDDERERHAAVPLNEDSTDPQENT